MHKPILVALTKFDQDREAAEGKQQLSGVQARVAKEKAYKEYLEQQLGTSIPGLAQYTKQKTFK